MSTASARHEEPRARPRRRLFVAFAGALDRSIVVENANGGDVVVGALATFAATRP